MEKSWIWKIKMVHEFVKSLWIQKMLTKLKNGNQERNKKTEMKKEKKNVRKKYRKNGLESI